MKLTTLIPQLHPEIRSLLKKSTNTHTRTHILTHTERGGRGTNDLKPFQTYAPKLYICRILQHKPFRSNPFHTENSASKSDHTPNTNILKKLQNASETRRFWGFLAADTDPILYFYHKLVTDPYIPIALLFQQ